jgi:capsular exopolysaccharide synthesis family protein
MSVNLALALAERGRTCIVDADLRKEGVARAFGVVADRGLADVLQEDMQIEEVLVPSVEVPNLTLLPTGAPCIDAARFIASAAMSRVIQHLRTQFDFVLIDSPPILPFSDGRVLSTMVDGVLLVGRSGVTKRDALRRSLDLLQEVRSAPVIQIVLNAVEVSAVEYRSYYRYGNKETKG